MRDDKVLTAQETEPRLTEALQDFHAALPIPDGAEAWERMNERLKAGKPEKPWKHWLKLGVVAAGLTLVIHLLFGMVNPVQAIFRYYFEVYRGDNFTSVSFGNYDTKVPPEGMLTAPPPEEDRYGKYIPGESRTLEPGEQVPVPVNAAPDPNERIYTSLKEAAPFVSFPIHMPDPMPEGYELKQVRFYLHPGEEKTSLIWITMWNASARSEIHLQEMPYSPDSRTGMSMTIGGDPDVKVRELDVGGGRGILILMKNFAEVHWYTDTMNFRLQGPFNEKEILRMAESLKKVSK